MMKLSKGLLLLGLSAVSTGCMSAYLKSVGGETDKVYSKVFLVNYDLAWNSVQESLKSAPIEAADRETGSLVTQWVENTKERNALESLDGSPIYVKAQNRYIVTVSRGFIDGGGESARVTVLREQVGRRDILDDWKLVPSDAIEEKTLLYRIARIISVRKKMAAVAEAKLKRKMEAVGQDPAPTEEARSPSPPPDTLSPGELPAELPPEEGSQSAPTSAEPVDGISVGDEGLED